MQRGIIVNENDKPRHNEILDLGLEFAISPLKLQFRTVRKRVWTGKSQKKTRQAHSSQENSIVKWPEGKLRANLRHSIDLTPARRRHHRSRGAYCETEPNSNLDCVIPHGSSLDDPRK